MQDCQVCGRSFDPFGFQVVVPELGTGFDRLECARTARANAPAASRMAAAPFVAVTAPVLAAPLASRATSPRFFATPAATLGLLAGGTAAAAFLWLRAISPDDASFALGDVAAPPAFGQARVQIDLRPAGETSQAVSRPEPSHAPRSPAASLVSAPSGSAHSRQTGGSHSTAPTGPTGPATPQPTTARPPAPAPSPTLRPTRPATHETKHVGLGHIKHGESGQHSPGHGLGHAQGGGKHSGKSHGKHNH